VLRPRHKPHSHHGQNSTEQSTTAVSTTAVRSHGAMLRIAAQFILPLGTALHLSSANRDTKTQTTLQASFAITLKNNFTQLHENAVNPLSPELNPICYLLALLAHDFLHVSRIRVKSFTLRLLLSYIYGAPILDVSRSHTTTQHSR
jgi:hypothetical protein